MYFIIYYKLNIQGKEMSTTVLAPNLEEEKQKIILMGGIVTRVEQVYY